MSIIIVDTHSLLSYTLITSHQIVCLVSLCLVFSGYLLFFQFDMWEHKDKPPKGNDYGLLTRKVRDVT